MPQPPRSTDAIAAIVFLDIAVIMVAARLMRAVMRQLRQPPVVGEVIAGVLLGPSLLGAFPGNLPGRLFPVDVQPYLAVIAQLGLIMFMFTVGLELDTKLVQGRLRMVGVVSASSIALPFGLGVALSYVIYQSHRLVTGPGVAGGSAAHVVRFAAFALFVAVSLSVTAFPLLARILTERGMHRTRIGAMALACGAVDDILAWTMLAVALGVATSTGVGDLGRLVGESAAFVVALVFIVKPQLNRVALRYREQGRLTPDMMAVVLIGLLACSYATSEIGIHAIFGAFAFGVVMPRSETRELFQDILGRLEQVSVLLLLPVFFVVTGLDTNVRGLGSSALTQLPAVLAVAVVGKFGGATLAARAQGVPARRAAAIGTLMNTRGLTGLVILNVGLSAGILDHQLFTMLVVMAILTTLMTGPVLRRVYPEAEVARDIAEAERALAGIPDAYRVLVLVEPGPDQAEVIEMAEALVAGEQPCEVVLSRLAAPARPLELGTGLGSGIGQMLESLGELRALAGQLEARGVASSVRSQFSSDVALDLVSQALAVDADVVLASLGERSPGSSAGSSRLSFLARVMSDAPGAVAIVVRDPVSAGKPDGPVSRTALGVLGAGERSNDLAALEMSLRLGARLGGQISVAEGSRATGRWVERAQRAGWRCESVGAYDRDDASDRDDAYDRDDASVSGLTFAGVGHGRRGTIDAASLERTLASMAGRGGGLGVLVSSSAGERSLERLVERGPHPEPKLPAHLLVVPAEAVPALPPAPLTSSS